MRSLFPWIALASLIGCASDPSSSVSNAKDGSVADSSSDAADAVGKDTTQDPTPPDAPPSDVSIPTDAVEEADGTPPPADGPLVIQYPDKRVGIFYLAWHAFASDTMNQLQPADRFTLEDVVRSPSLHFSDILAKHNLLGQAASFHYHQKPKLGFYCLYRKRPSEPAYTEPDYVPDCADIPATASAHASQLWSAGVDFVYMDITNFGAWSPGADVMGLRPVEVLLEEWSALRKNGIPTPQIAAWVPASAVPAGQTPMFQRVLELYANPAFDGVLLTQQASGKKILFVVDNGGFPPDPGHLATIAAAGVIPVHLWGNLDPGPLANGVAGWMQPCTRGGGFTTIVRPGDACQQGYSSNTAIGTVLSVSASYQVGYASLPFQSSGKMGGLTLKKQFETAFGVHPDWLLVNEWNEHIAQPQPNPYEPALGSLRRSMGEGDVPGGDPGADWLWVDGYGTGFARDLEPTEQDNGAGYDLLKSCLNVYRSGHGSCDLPGEACCQLGAGMNVVMSLRGKSDGGSMTTDHVLTISEQERDTLVSSGSWAEVCNPFYGPPGLCGGGTTVDGPFLLFGDAGADRVLIYRCYSGADHFISTDPGCEGRVVEGPLGWASTVRTTEAPRMLRRCYNAPAIVHFHSVDEHCPAGMQEEAPFGYVR
ncbi:MAG: hypothetical protein HY898_08850 [Deltaproteobacteria bacterium]|nr:hypothetical protein [Deltaproteobacteria bacterium]